MTGVTQRRTHQRSMTQWQNVTGIIGCRSLHASRHVPATCCLSPACQLQPCICEATQHPICGAFHIALHAQAGQSDSVKVPASGCVLPAELRNAEQGPQDLVKDNYVVPESKFLPLAVHNGIQPLQLPGGICPGLLVPHIPA